MSEGQGDRATAVDAPTAFAPPPLAWSWQRFAASTVDDIHDLLALRSAVFVVEQRCVFLDPDRHDRHAWHLLGRAGPDAGAPLVAYLRCLDPGSRYPEASIGRVVVATAARSGGLGRALMREGIARSIAAWPGHDIVLNAQSHLAAFYASLGFAAEGAPYDEDGIEHVAMRRRAGR